MEKNKFSTKTLTTCALLTAMAVILARFVAITPSETTRISFEAVPIFLAGMLFGPVAGVLVGFVNGMVTDVADLCDEMYENAAMHNENGAWQMIFGVNTIPGYRRRGLAEMVLRRVIDDARSQGRKGLVLTCKDRLVHYYAKLGFVSEGISESGHGGVVWYQMRLTF